MLFYPWGDVWKSWGSGGYNFAALPYNDVSTTTNLTTSRVSSPNLGRWLTPDPAGQDVADPSDPQTWNMYAYVRGNPTTLTDPTGLDPPGSPPQSPNVSCTMDRASVPCSEMYAALHYGLADLCPNNDCSGLRAVQGPGDSTFFETWVPTKFTTSEHSGELTINMTTGHWSTVGVVDDSPSWWGTFAESFVTNFPATTWSSMTSSNGCVAQFATTAFDGLSPFPTTPSASDLVVPAANFLSAVKLNSALAYAASRPNVLGGTGLLYPLNSGVFRGMLSAAQELSNNIPMMQLVAAEGQALYTETRAAWSGGCR